MNNCDLSSLDLLERARQESDSASQELLLRFRQPLLNRIRLMMGAGVRRIAESQDFLQEVMVDFLEDSYHMKFRTDIDILRWMTAVARNHIRMAGRRKRILAFDSLSASFSIEAVPTPDSSPASKAAVHEKAVLLAEGLEKLKEEHREVIELHNLESMRLKKVAERMGRSYEAVKKLHTRAMMQLGIILSPPRS
jgi:RNA polymerase sigma-70 factor (ECF subfamily)